MFEAAQVAGIGLALIGAIFTAAVQLSVRLGTDEGKALDAVLVVMLTNVVLLTPPVLFVYYPAYKLTFAAVGSFVAAGIAGTMIGRMLAYTSIDRVGASRTAPIVASWALFSTAFGVLIFGESLTLPKGVGVVLIVVGVSVIGWETSQTTGESLTRRELALGLVLPFGAAFALGWEPVFASFGLGEGTPAPVGLVVKTVSGSIGFGLFLWWQNELPALRDAGNGEMRWFVVGGVASTISLTGYYLALEVADISVVAPIMSTSTMFVVVLSAVLMPGRLERVTRLLVFGAVTVVAGVSTLTISL